jgi:hypothetical protein
MSEIMDTTLFFANAKMVKVNIGNRLVTVPVTAKYEKTNSITKYQEYRVLTWDGWLSVDADSFNRAREAEVQDGEPMWEAMFRIQRELKEAVNG